MKYRVIKPFPGFGYIAGDLLEKVSARRFAQNRPNAPIIKECTLQQHPDYFEIYQDVDEKE